MHDFGIVWSERSLLLSGLANTVVLTVLASVGAFALGTLLCPLLMRRERAVAWAAHAFVDGFRCTPFLLFAYLVYYGLPTVGISFDSWGAGLFALVMYHTAYVAEILRGAWAAQPKAPVEAGHAFGFRGFGLWRRIVMPPLLLAAGPLLGNQVIQIVKDSAFLTVIALPELTHAANSIQSRHYVPFAALLTALLLYWALCLVVEAGVAAVGRMAEARR